MGETSVARKSDWWPGRRMADWLDWLEHPMRDFDRVMRIEETRDGDSLTIRAELPGIDPDKDVTVSIENDVLTIKGERREEEKEKNRHEFHYGSFTRSITLPKGVNADEITATYKDGVLEVRVPQAAETSAAVKVPVRREEKA